LSSRRYPRVSIKIKVTEGDRWRIGKISLEGLKRTSVSDLRKELTLREGDQAYPLVLEKNIARLSSLSHIVSVEALWGKEENGARNLVLKLEEISPWRLSTRVGFESEDGAQLAFRLRRENLNGLGHVASIDSDFSSKERHVVLRYSVPKLYKSLYQKVREQDWIGSYLIGEQVNLISSNDIKNKAFVTGFSFGRESELSSEVFDVTYREDRNIDGSFPTLRGKVLHRKSSLPLPMQPGKGWGWHFNGQMVAYLDRNRYAYIGDYRTSYGFKLGGSVMTPWLRLGHKWSLGPSFNLPISDRFFLGGTGSLRGFDDDSLTSGNKKGGESLAAFGTELFYPIEDWIDGSVFYEWGRVFDQPAFMGAGDPGHSLGMGLLIRTPVGPIQGYFAHPIGEDRIGHLGIQLGTIF
jgi:outer membrane protein insertion porin family